MDKNKLFQQFVGFTSAVHQVTNDMTKDVKLEDITPLQYKMLEYIAVSQPLTLSEISDCLHISLPNSSREIKKIMDKQLCEKVMDANDKRKFHIRLTKKGTAMMNDVFEQIEHRFQERIKSLSESELQEVEQALYLLKTKVF